MKKTLLSLAAGAILLASATPVFAQEITKEGTASKGQVEVNHQQSWHKHAQEKKLSPPAKHERLIKVANKLGVSATGKTDTELKEAIQAKFHDKLMEKANKSGIQAAGKTDKQVKEELAKKFQSAKHEKLMNAASKAGIQTAGKTDKQIWEALKAKSPEKFTHPNGKDAKEHKVKANHDKTQKTTDNENVEK
ncbi:hypothetical protein PP175_27725 (plasmid) [Aneurinibacillus sp. Ricciae_BoGa-3]|uniref:hypothetical protein n=1 Tax=Aneurinibacillus sp. Ricciae_BoGa-3 TaxID=3022697 RepID=UPI002340B86E|nr:hypothetical protein [Aneurinibacillus sp. Ricciae_BoGa-3]WCK56983.1 hypothetical protein PP175_27725 [Aneurinibacillus sp. Ricciae_BoGa-3]